jgi:hypothetical protein
MRRRVLASLLTLTIAAFCLASESAAQGKGPKDDDRVILKGKAAGAVVLPVSGTNLLNGLFTLQRFAARGSGGIDAVGVLSGTLTNGTTFVKPIRLPVTEININGASRTFPAAETGFAPAPSGTRAVWDHEAPAPAPGIVLAQAQPPAEDCGILSLTIGGIALNVLGLQVNLEDIVLAISGDTEGVLGNLICSVLDALSGVINLIVGLLNAILGLLGGLTGGLGGGLGA